MISYQNKIKDNKINKNNNSNKKLKIDKNIFLERSYDIIFENKKSNMSNFKKVLKTYNFNSPNYISKNNNNLSLSAKKINLSGEKKRSKISRNINYSPTINLNNRTLSINRKNINNNKLKNLTNIRKKNVNNLIVNRIKRNIIKNKKKIKFNKNNEEGYTEQFIKRAVVFVLRLAPFRRLAQEVVAEHHHEEVDGAEDVEHLRDPQAVLDEFHEGRGNGLGQAEAHDRDSRGQPLLLGEPEHERLDGREVADAKADAHDAAVEDVDADQRCKTRGELDAEARAQHADGEADARDERGLVDVLLNHAPGEGGRHAQEEDGERKCPADGEWAHADLFGDERLEGRPAVDSAN